MDVITCSGCVFSSIRLVPFNHDDTRRFADLVHEKTSSQQAREYLLLYPKPDSEGLLSWSCQALTAFTVRATVIG